MLKVIDFFAISLLVIIIKAETDPEELCLEKLLVPLKEGCSNKVYDDILSIWDADDCAYREIGLLGDDDELHPEKFIEFLKPHLTENHRDTFLNLELQSCVEEGANLPAPSQPVDLVYRFTACLWKDKRYFDQVFGCPLPEHYGYPRYEDEYF